MTEATRSRRDEFEKPVRERRFDEELEIDRTTSFLKSVLSSSPNLKGFVVGISGGVDSAVVAALCARAAGSDRVHGILLFEEDSEDSTDFHDAVKLIDLLGIKRSDVRINPVVSAILKQLGNASLRPSRLTLANIKARLRMVLLYTFANEEASLVAGTGDRSEAMIGYFTKYGDGGVDLLPIGHLYKTEVRKLAKKLGVPESIVRKPSSPNLWKGHRATDEIPADYDALDKILSMLYDQSLSPKEVASSLGLDQGTVDEVIAKNLSSRHKREFPKMVER